MGIGPFHEVGHLIYKVASERLARAKRWPEVVQGKQRERVLGVWSGISGPDGADGEEGPR